MLRPSLTLATALLLSGAALATDSNDVYDGRWSPGS